VSLVGQRPIADAFDFAERIAAQEQETRRVFAGDYPTCVGWQSTIPEHKVFDGLARDDPWARRPRMGPNSGQLTAMSWNRGRAAHGR
jgi:hypothetical protein